MVKTITFTLLLFVCCTPVAMAEEAPPPPETNTILQVSHILAPAQSRPGSWTTTMRPMTPILVVPKAYNVPLVCQRVPRLIEALLNYFLKEPAPVDRKLHLDSTALEAKKAVMAAHVNRAIGIDAVSEVYVFEGGKALSAGVASRLPGGKASTACGPVLEEYEKKIKAILEE